LQGVHEELMHGDPGDGRTGEDGGSQDGYLLQYPIHASREAADAGAVACVLRERSGTNETLVFCDSGGD
jgi:hypothetical protein